MSGVSTHTDDARKGASEASREACSSLDSRRRTGSAGDAALSGRWGDPDARARRDREIVCRVKAGETQRDVGRAFGLSHTRVGHIMRQKLPADAVALVRRGERIASRLERAETYLEQYRAGFTIAEIGQHFGLTAAAIRATLQEHPDYRPRSGARQRSFADVEVPAWVPERHRDLYRRLAVSNDEHVAAACLRRRKAWEARQ